MRISDWSSDVCSSDLSSSAPTIRAAETVVVHLLEAEQLHLAQLGATSGIDRFADTSLWQRLPTGEPYFPAASSWLRGRVVGTVPAGVATVIVVQALEAHTNDPDEASPTHRRVYHNRTWHRPGDHSRIACPCPRGAVHPVRRVSAERAPRGTRTPRWCRPRSEAHTPELQSL